jgi:uncharacterized membrane protein YdjX (TVP38/TMEM64 family)
MDQAPTTATIAESVPLTPWWRRVVASRAVHVIVLIVVLGGVLASWLSSVGGVAGLRQRFGLAAAAVIIPVHAVIAISPFPSEVVAFGISAIYGFWTGALLSWAGWMVAAVSHYALVRRAAVELDLDSVLTRLPRWLRRFPVHHPAFLIFGRWVPYGPQMVCTVAGAFRVPFWRFAWCAAVSIVPVALFFAALATGLVTR